MRKTFVRNLNRNKAWERKSFFSLLFEFSECDNDHQRGNEYPGITELKPSLRMVGQGNRRSEFPR